MHRAVRGLGEQKGFGTGQDSERIGEGCVGSAQTHLQRPHVGLVDVREPQAQGDEKHQGPPWRRWRPVGDVGSSGDPITVPVGTCGKRGSPCTRKAAPARPS